VVQQRLGALGAAGGEALQRVAHWLRRAAAALQQHEQEQQKQRILRR
jgi:hypothetical protein